MAPRGRTVRARKTVRKNFGAVSRQCRDFGIFCQQAAHVFGVRPELRTPVPQSYPKHLRRTAYGHGALVATQNSPLRQNMNVFNFSFDAETFKANLIARLQKALTENKKLNELTGGKMATLGKLQNLDNLMKNPEVQKELQGIKDLDQYRDRLGEIQK